MTDQMAERLSRWFYVNGLQVVHRGVDARPVAGLFPDLARFVTTPDDISAEELCPVEEEGLRCSLRADHGFHVMTTEA